MGFLTELWMPIVVSAALVFVASSVFHMVLPFHKGDYGQLPDEAKVDEALQGVPPGQYMIPYCTSETMKSPEIQEKMKTGPMGTIRLCGPFSFGRNLGLMFVINLLVSVFVAYQAHAMNLSGDFMHVFRITGVAAVMAYTFGWMPGTVWYGTTKSGFWAYLFDGIVYGLITGAVFGWMWPQAAAAAV
ncbi:MAG: hypothetical protein HZC36_10445 [Armatimonadetes bacterium]|nr:hypothetical protein [Armatimonadota bacterium]